MATSMKYNDKLDASEQVDAEEEIAGIIFDAASEDGELCEEGCAASGRSILWAVLARFRPDLFDGHPDDDG